MPPTYIKSKHYVKSIIDSSINMADAARKAGVPYITFKDWSIKYGLYNPRPGYKKKLSDIKTNWGILSRLYRDNIKEEVCESCGMGNIWNGKKIKLTLHHIDGNNKNNSIENLMILCPNCHSQTDNFCGKNIPNSSNG